MSAFFGSGQSQRSFYRSSLRIFLICFATTTNGWSTQLVTYGLDLIGIGDSPNEWSLLWVDIVEKLGPFTQTAEFLEDHSDFWRHTKSGFAMAPQTKMDFLHF